VLNQEAVRPRMLRPELRISEAIERVALKAMAKPREERYPNMEAFSADLERVLNGEWVDAPLPESTVNAPPAGAASRAWLFAAIAMVLLGGGALLWAGRIGRTPVTPPVRPAPTPAPAPTTPPSSVVVHIETVPPGAEVRQDDKLIGQAPRPLMLPRSDTPVHLSFKLDGYELYTTDVIPRTETTLHVNLTPKPKTRPKKASTPSEPQPPKKSEDGETLDNPYLKKK
jgi:hypothetical protein